MDELHATVINQGNGNYVLRVDTKYYDTRVNGQLLPPMEYKQDQTYPLRDGDHIQLSERVGILWIRVHGDLKQPDQTMLVFEMK